MLFISSLFFSLALLFAASSSVLLIVMAVLKNSAFYGELINTSDIEYKKAVINLQNRRSMQIFHSKKH